MGYIKGIIGYTLTIIVFILFLLLHILSIGFFKPTETDWFENFGKFVSKLILNKYE